MPEDAVIPLSKNDEKKLLDMYERPYVEGAIKEQVCFVLFNATIKASIVITFINSFYYKN